MKSRTLFFCSLLITLVFAVGCQTVEDRIKKNPDAFARLDPATQEKIKQGIIDLGFGPDLVFMALGEPTEKRETIDDAGRSEVWAYNTFYQRYDGTSFVGYERRVYYDPVVKSYRTYYEPSFVENYRQEKQELIRVIFKNDKVTTIEQVKP